MKDINLQLQKNIQDVLHYDKGNAVENIVKLVFETIINAEKSQFLSTSEGNKVNGYYQRLALKELTSTSSLTFHKSQLLAGVRF
ncbi:hypothetical protein B4919_07495 [Francisella tularensis subsp. novicida]|uniref:hypothetical protein n=1 Tax=Francisella tularensis TaxID=263 RepID=UPI000CE29586|nr:hypothetical protein [Francisella tularensis]AVC44632.1 hypothetical protein B4919_07495 [Francisella tularensis subsp. novicida]